MVEKLESITDMINRIPNKEETKCLNWIQIKTSEEYVSADDLKQADENLFDKLPSLVNIALKKDNIEVDSDIISSEKLLKNDDLIIKNISISEKEKEKIILFLNQDKYKDFICDIFNYKGTPQEEVVCKFIYTLFHPPRPLPNDCKKLNVKLEGHNLLPVYKYNGIKNELNRYYTLLVIGETGAGKTTLLDAFVNYLDDVQLIDNWRWKLVDENDFQSKYTSETQTTDITNYYINDRRKDGKCHIRIIDTPGFGDTKEVQKDQEITKKFEQYFKSGLSEVDYILITLKSSETRCTLSSQYVYDKISELFGNDIKDRFILMCTFSDGRKPICVDTASKHIYFQKYFRFNNSALFSPSTENDKTLKMFWKLGTDSLTEFFKHIQFKNNLPVSLTLSKEVLRNREFLYAFANTWEKIIEQGFVDLCIVREFYRLIEKNRKLIDDNKAFTYVVQKEIYTKKSLDKDCHVCIDCNVICCQVCPWPNDSALSKCAHFTKNNNFKCPKCNGCSIERHCRPEYIIVKSFINETKTYDNKQRTYYEGLTNLSNIERHLLEQKSKMEKLGENIFKLMNEGKSYIKKLDEIALKPNLFSNKEYFLNLIRHEEDNKRVGWQERVNDLKFLQIKAKNLELLSNSNSLVDLFPEYKKEIQELGKDSKNKDLCLIF